MPEDDDDVEAFFERMFAELRELNIRFATLRILILEQLGVTDAQYAAAHAKATAAADVPPDAGTTTH